MIAEHPVVDVWRRACDPEALVSAAAVRGHALPDLSELPLEEACVLLRRGLQRVFIVEGEAKSLLRRLIDVAFAHARTEYTSVREYLRRIYCAEAPSCVNPGGVIVLTGPAGTGKSEVLKALSRILSSCPTEMSFPGHRDFALEPYHLVAAKTLDSAAKIFRAVGHGVELETKSDPIKLAAKLRYQRGTCLIGIDELQFLTQSAAANARIATVLLGMHELPVPCVVACNYSLLHRLLSRNHEERQRYLGHPIVMLSDAADSKAWLDLLADYRIVMDSLIGFNLSDESKLLWLQTAGLKRVLVELLVRAYRVARAAGRDRISVADLTRGYLAHEFVTYREDVEEYTRYVLTGVSPRKDLQCPLPHELSRTAEARHQLKAAREESVEAAARVSALPGEVRKALLDLGGDQPLKRQSTPSRPRSKKNLAALLEAGGRVLGGIQRPAK